MARSKDEFEPAAKPCRRTTRVQTLLWNPGFNDRFPSIPHLTFALMMIVSLLATGIDPRSLKASELLAGAAKVDITNVDAGLVNDRLYARALILQNETSTAVIVSVDAVAIGEIGHIRNDYLENVRSRVETELEIPSKQILINASHCHGVVSADVADRTCRAIAEAHQRMVPVHIAAGSGHENRVSENRRLKLKNGKVADVRHAYSTPSDEDVAQVGPIDPQIGILKLDRVDGTTLAVVYQFACHPIQGVPSGGNTADITGFSSRVIEDNLSDGAIALFLQGCGGDINPVGYKAVDAPRDAEHLGNMLGLSTLQGIRKLRCRDDSRLHSIHEVLTLPRADLADRIATVEAEQQRLVQSLKGTSLNLKTFLPLMAKYKLSPEFPSYSSHRYLHEQDLGRDDLTKLDAENRRNLQAYLANIAIMEQLTRAQTNLALLRKHQARNVASGKRTIDVEVAALRVGDFTLITFPGELTVQIGLNIKKASPYALTFVSGYTNGYIYYAPTADQLMNPGEAQEDCDCLLAPEWQALFETRAIEILKKL